MTDPTIHGNLRSISASSILTEIGNDLGAIRQADRLTWSDIGRVLGKSADQAAKYADGTADMGVVSYQLARWQWNGRFTGSIDRLIAGCRPNEECDRGRQSKVLKAALALSIALEDDDQIDANEVRANRPAIEVAIEALSGLLDKLAPRAAA